MTYLLLTKYTFKKGTPAARSFICQEFYFLFIYKCFFFPFYIGNLDTNDARICKDIRRLWNTSMYKPFSEASIQNKMKTENTSFEAAHMTFT